MTAHESYRAARDHLLDARLDLAEATTAYVPPRDPQFNWAQDWFDVVAATEPTASRVALKVVEADGTATWTTYSQMSARSDQVAAWLTSVGVAPGHRVLLMLGNRVELWEVLLAAMKIGAVVIPATTLLTTSDLRDRVTRGRVSVVVTAAGDTAKLDLVEGDFTRVVIGAEPGAVPDGWVDYAQSDDPSYVSAGPPPRMAGGDDTLLLYFTSGTTAQPKLVEHTHLSYPVGHLSTTYWLGLQPGDVHLNVSSPGWGKHAWSSFFAPWIAEATILVVNQARFDAGALLEVMAEEGVTTFCAPPTVYRMLIQHDLPAWRDRLSLREMAGAGEPLNPEVIAQVRSGLGLTIRDGFGQTETTAQVGNPPRLEVVPGSMGLPLPGFDVVLVDASTGEEVAPGVEGELCLRLDGPAGRPVGLMPGYHDDPELTARVTRQGLYHTGDVAVRDESGYITFVGRSDDVFKASDFRISPFELESVLLEHPAVSEAAVVPSPDPTRLAVPKAFVALAPGYDPTEDTAREILGYARTNLAPYKRVRRLEFAELPKTISGKIRRVELRDAEERAHAGGSGEAAHEDGREFWDTDFPELRSEG